MDFKEYLKQIDEVIENGKYKDSWESLSGHATPKWYRDAKFGIFIHWGIYSVPAFGNEWYSRNMYDKKHREFKHHIEKYGQHKDFGYKDFIPMFKAEKFNADEWISLFKESGAKYIMPVAEHHDGFAMYDTELNRWNSKNMGPCRDVAGEIKAACEKEGLVYCASSHRAEHYFFMNMGRTIDSDVNDERYADFYGPAHLSENFNSDAMFETAGDVRAESPTKEFLDDWLVRTCELVDRYQPRVVYFDWWIQNRAFKPYLKKFAAYYYNRAVEWGEEVTINYKYHAYPATVATFDVERGALKGISPTPWQTCTSIAKNSWGYTENNKFKSVNHIVCDLIDIVSKNGMMLLNVGPKADGTITAEETSILKGIGKWLKTNGEGIYATSPWRVFGEGKANVKDGFFQDNKEKGYKEKDFRFTYKQGSIYVFQMKPTAKKSVKIKTFKKTSEDLLVSSVKLLGRNEELRFTRNNKYMEIYLPEALNSDLPVCFKLELE